MVGCGDFFYYFLFNIFLRQSIATIIMRTRYVIADVYHWESLDRLHLIGQFFT